jgi:hypothetical protein
VTAYICFICFDRASMCKWFTSPITLSHSLLRHHFIGLFGYWLFKPIFVLIY